MCHTLFRCPAEHHALLARSPSPVDRSLETKEAPRSCNRAGTRCIPSLGTSRGASLLSHELSGPPPSERGTPPRWVLCRPRVALVGSAGRRCSSWPAPVPPLPPRPLRGHGPRAAGSGRGVVLFLSRFFGFSNLLFSRGAVFAPRGATSGGFILRDAPFKGFFPCYISHSTLPGQRIQPVPGIPWWIGEYTCNKASKGRLSRLRG